MLNCRKPNLTGDSSSHYGVIFNRSTRHLISDGEHNSSRAAAAQPARRAGGAEICEEIRVLRGLSS